jgi:release factor glutamine methyltransferase
LFDMILSNPPYIPSRVIPSLQPEIHGFEPLAALNGGEDGLSAIRRILHEAPRHLRPGGRLLLEIGHDQRKAVHRIARECGQYADITFSRDYAGHDRVVQVKKRDSGD